MFAGSFCSLAYISQPAYNHELNVFNQIALAAKKALLKTYLAHAAGQAFHFSHF